MQTQQPGGAGGAQTSGSSGTATTGAVSLPALPLCKYKCMHINIQNKWVMTFNSLSRWSIYLPHTKRFILEPWAWSCKPAPSAISVVMRTWLKRESWFKPWPHPVDVWPCTDHWGPSSLAFCTCKVIFLKEHCPTSKEFQKKYICVKQLLYAWHRNLLNNCEQFLFWKPPH